MLKDNSRRLIGFICGLLLFSTALIPWGIADQRFLWSFELFNHFYTLVFKMTLILVWCTGLAECFAAIKLKGISRDLAFIAAGVILVLYMLVAKTSPIAWTNFAPLVSMPIVIQGFVLFSIVMFALSTGIRLRDCSATAASKIQTSSSAILIILSLYGIVLTVRSSASFVVAAFDISALTICCVGTGLVLSQCWNEQDIKRIRRGRILVLVGILIPVAGQILEPVLSGDQIVGIFSYLNTEIIIASALLLALKGSIELSLRYRPALVSSVCLFAAGIGLVMPQIQSSIAPAITREPSVTQTLGIELVRTGDWTQWCGGVDRNMIWNEKGLPEQFEELTPGKTTNLKNVKWVVPLAKRTLGSPVIANGRVFIGGENMEAGNETSMLWCFEESTGKLLWRMASPYIPWLYNLSTFGNCATPTIDGDRLYTCNHLADVLCLKVDGMINGNRGPFKDEAQYFASGRKVERSEILPNGKRIVELSTGTLANITPMDADIIWRFDLIAGANAWPFNALNSAVLVRGNVLFIGTGSVRSEPYFKTESSAIKIDAWKAQSGNAFYDSPSLIALDKATGRLVARDREDSFGETFHGAHASPTLCKIHGKDLLVYGAGNATCYAFDPDFIPGRKGEPGTLSCVWKFNCLGDRVTRAEIIGTPVFYKNRVYVAIGNDLAKSGAAAGPGRLVCIDATLTGDITAKGRIWSNDDIRSSACTVAIADGILYTGDAAGNIYAIDADTGKLLWRHTAKHPVWSSPLVVDGKVYFGLHGGGVIVFAHGITKKIISENLGSADIISSPAVANGVLYFATQRHLYALELGKSGGLVDQSRAIESVKNVHP